MDLVDYSQEAYDKVVKEYTDFAAKLNVKDVRFVPMSALHGDNVVSRGENMSWYEGGTLLHNLETVHISSDHNLRDCRFPVQTVIRPHSDEYHDFRGYAGRVAGGVFKKGDSVVALPSGLESKIAAIHTMTGELEEAFPPQSVTITLEDDIDISRGDVLVRSENRPEGQQDLDVMLCWLNANPPRPRAKYVIKHTTAEARAMITDIQYKMDINTLHRMEEDKAIKMNDIARVKIRSTKPLFADDYTVNRVTGSIILVDEATNETVAAGMGKCGLRSHLSEMLQIWRNVKHILTQIRRVAQPYRIRTASIFISRIFSNILQVRIPSNLKSTSRPYYKFKLHMISNFCQ